MYCRVLLLLDMLSFTAVKYSLTGVLVVMVATSSNGWPCVKQLALVKGIGSKICSKYLTRAVEL